MKRHCDYCKKRYEADSRNIKRGWGLCCSKSCAAHKREKSKPTYDPLTVHLNNLKREGLTMETHFLSYDGAEFDEWGDLDIGIK